MQIGSLHFSPGPWPALATVLLVLLFVRLGFWQLDRASQKQALLEDLETKQQLAPLTSLGNITSEERARWRRAVLSGVFVDKPLFLLDNQVSAGRAGYFVYSIFQLDPNSRVLVNRGWTQAMPRRENLPPLATPTAPLQLSGTIKNPPFTGRQLAENTDEAMGGGVIRLQYLDIDHLNSKYDLDLQPFVFRLDAGADAAYKLDWPLPVTGKEKHLGYAFQWFAMSVAIMVIFMALNLGRNRPGE